jgi:hypothetical protein
MLPPFSEIVGNIINEYDGRQHINTNNISTFLSGCAVNTG